MPSPAANNHNPATSLSTGPPGSPADAYHVAVYVTGAAQYPTVVNGIGGYAVPQV